MKKIVTNALLIAAFLPMQTMAMTGTSSFPADKHHVMWTNSKGEQKCCTKKTKEKAERCAAKLRNKQATNVQVMAGTSKDM